MFEAFAVLEVVVIAIHFHQAHHTNAIFADVVQFVVVLEQANIIVRLILGGLAAVFTKVIPNGIGIGVVLDVANTSVHIGIATKVVGLTVDFSPLSLVVAGAIAITGTGCIHNPSALRSTVLIEGILDTVDGLLTNIQFEVGACVAVQAVSILPAGLQHAIDGVVQLAVHLEDAGAGSVDLATAFISANKLVANDLVIVGNLNLGNNGAPIHDRLTSLAVSAVLVTCLGSGSFLIQDSQLCIMLVVGRRNGGQLSSHMDVATEGCAVHNTVNQINIDVDHRLVAHASNRDIGIGHEIVAVIGPNADRDAHNCTTLSLRTTISFNDHSQQFGDFVILESSLEARSNNRALDFPGIRVVQLQLNFHLVDSGQISYIDVHIVDGLCLGGLAGIVVTAQLHGCVTCNSEGSVQRSGVAQLILNLELHSVNTCSQLNIALGRQRIAGNSSLNFNTVHEDLTGSQIQRSVISNSCGECNIVTSDGSAIFQRNSNIGSGISGVGNGGQHSVIHSGAVVQGNIINVEGNDIRSIGLHIGTDKRGRTGVRLVRRRHSRQIVVLADIDGSIDPTGLRNIRIGSRVQIDLLAGGSRGEHKVILHARCFSVNRPVCIGIELRLECQALTKCIITATTGRECILRNVNPHTQSGSLQAVCNITENNNLIRIKEDVVRPACKSGVGIIQAPCQCILTISDLAAICGSSHKGSTTQVLIELASQRIGANQSVVHTILLAPLLSLFKAHEASLVAVFKVPNNFGTLAELNSISQLGFAIGNGRIDTCNAGIRGGSKLEAFQHTCIFIGQCYGYAIGIVIHIGFANRCYDGQSNGTHLIRSGIRNYSRSSRKLEYERICNDDLFGTDHLTIGANLNLYLTLFAVRSKDTICNRAKGLIGQSPAYITGHFHSIAMGIDGFCTEGVDSLGSDVVIIRLNIHIIENAGRRNVGSNEDAVCGGTLCAVTGNGTHGDFLFANALGNEGGGTATVTVGSPLAAQRQHDFAFFELAAEALGVVRTTAVIHTNDQGTVSLNADHGTGSIAGGLTDFLLVDQLAVFNDHAEGNAHCMQQSAIFQIAVVLSSVEGLDIARNVAFSILEYVQDGAGRRSLALHAQVLTIVHQNAGRIGVIVQVSVHTADNVIAEVFLVILCHFGQFLMRPIRLISGILCQLIDLVVTGNDRDIRIGRINLNHVQHLSAGAVSVIQDDLRFHGCAGNQDVILLGDYIVITSFAEGGAAEDHIIVCPTRDRRKCGERNQTHEHRNRDQHGNYADGCFSCHFNFSFFIVLYPCILDAKIYGGEMFA